jgi:hypothetical protein
MFNNESVLKSIARRVFPDMGTFSSGGEAGIGLWDARLSVGGGVAWLTVGLGRDELFEIRVQGSRVEAVYAVPAVVEYGDGKRGYGTAWADSRRWKCDWVDVPRVSADIREFFNNTDEFLNEAAKVRRILEGSSAGSREVPW